MTSPEPCDPYILPPVTHVQRPDGQSAIRRVGFEIEFSGLNLDEATACVADAVHGEVAGSTAAEATVSVPGLGDFRIEVDWALLKRMAKDENQSGEDDAQWLATLSRAAAVLVPIEVVCPPVPIDDTHRLDAITTALRKHGAVGTSESVIAAYGVHINPEIPALDAATIGNYLRAFCLLQWWLVDKHSVDNMRRLSPYVDLYPREYLARVLSRKDMSIDDIFSDYLEHNPTRNRALDLLPLLSEIDAQRVQKTVEDDRVKARPTFHYRLPNCHIERSNWSLATSWNIWCVVERLADLPDHLDALSERFLELRRPLLDVDRSRWVKEVDQWLTDHALA